MYSLSSSATDGGAGSLVGDTVWVMSSCSSDDVETLELSEHTVNPGEPKTGPYDFELLKLLGKGGYGKVRLAARSCDLTSFIYFCFIVYTCMLYMYVTYIHLYDRSFSMFTQYSYDFRLNDIDRSANCIIL